MTSRRSTARAVRQRRRCLRDNRALASELDHEMPDLEAEMYAELGYDMVTGSFAVPSRLLRPGRRFSSSDGTPVD